MNPLWTMILAEIVVPAVIKAISERSEADNVGTIAEIASNPQAAVEKIVADPATKAKAVGVVAGWLGGILDLLSGKK